MIIIIGGWWRISCPLTNALLNGMSKTWSKLKKVKKTPNLKKSPKKSKKFRTLRMSSYQSLREIRSLILSIQGLRIKSGTE